jgi:hypothetical protein
MANSSRKTDALITVLALLALLLSSLGNLLTNNLPGLLPAVVQAHPQQYFGGAVAGVLLIFLVLVLFEPRTEIARINRRRRFWIVILRLVQGGLAAFADVVSNLVVLSFPGPFRHAGLALLLALVLVAPLLFEVLQTRVGRKKTDREAFLGQLTKRYNAYLDDPLQQKVRAALGIAETPTALRRPEVTVETLGAEDIPGGNDPVRVLSPEETLLGVYEEAGRHLFILGAPGAGKSTQLHELGRALVQRAQKDLAAPLPVILDLSTWAANPNDPLERWLVDEIVRAYDTDKGTAARWVETQQIAPLLDALDVMAEADRPRCVEAINAYRAAHPTVPMVVCSRLEEYQQLGIRLGLPRAVTLQPLSNEAIDEALASGGPRQATLRRVVAEDADLRDALRTPLILNLVVLTYGALRGDEIPPVTDLPTWRRELFSRYVEKALQHLPGTEPQPIDYDEGTFQRTLAWLGYELREHSEGTFYLEQLQEDWLPDAATRRRYWRIRRLVDGLLFGLLLGLLGGLVFGLRGGLRGGLVVGLGFGLLLGLLFGQNYGGRAALQHLASRIALRRSRTVPPRLVRFLNEASTLVLLRRVGGRYQFIHQLLRDYFADQYVPHETPVTVARGSKA